MLLLLRVAPIDVVVAVFDGFVELFGPKVKLLFAFFETDGGFF